MSFHLPLTISFLPGFTTYPQNRNLNQALYDDVTWR
jgi:hypothetical protein